MGAIVEEQDRLGRQSLGEGILMAREVAAYLRLTETNVCKPASSGDLPGFKIGKPSRFDGE